MHSHTNKPSSLIGGMGEYLRALWVDFSFCVFVCVYNCNNRNLNIKQTGWSKERGPRPRGWNTFHRRCERLRMWFSLTSTRNLFVWRRLDRCHSRPCNRYNYIGGGSASAVSLRDSVLLRFFLLLLRFNHKYTVFRCRISCTSTDMRARGESVCFAPCSPLSLCPLCVGLVCMFVFPQPNFAAYIRDRVSALNMYLN